MSSLTSIIASFLKVWNKFITKRKVKSISESMITLSISVDYPFLIWLMQNNLMDISGIDQLDKKNVLHSHREYLTKN